jgi:hypothetical protein
MPDSRSSVFGELDDFRAAFWGDETGLRSDPVRGGSYAPRGHTPTERPSHKRAGLGLISALTNKGELPSRRRS